jgi:para-aminobenzoate synthetase component 1
MDTTLNPCSFELADVPAFKQKMLNWLEPFSIFCYLDNQQYSVAPHLMECLVAVGAVQVIEGGDIQDVDDFIKGKPWVFGHLSYELKNSLHNLTSQKTDCIGFPLFYFFAPEVVLKINDQQVTVYAKEPKKIFDDINAKASPEENVFASSIVPKPVLTKEAYIEKVQALQAHILRGDCYEINFCQEFFAADASINPSVVFQKLLMISPNPFSAFYRLHDKYLLCASPERFLLKKGKRVISQPMKGTAGRNLVSTNEDEALKQGLRNNQKEQAENVMVVDLVRNDLTQVCREDSVTVDELFGVYTYPQVHQMVSTISGQLKDHVRFSDIIKASFPMGSMTGAPKHRVMQLIDEYEPSARGIFSGAVGYIDPQNDFDFNVVIRSLMYNATKGFLSYKVGSAITFYSDAEKEWEECMLKAEAIRQALGV